MAEMAVVSAITEKWAPVVLDKLFREVSLITSFKDDFSFFSDELVSIQCLFNDTRELKNSSTMSNWLDKLEDFMVDAVEIVDECAAARKFGNPIFRYKMARKIKSLKDRIIKIHHSGKYIRYQTSVVDVKTYTSDDKRERSSVLLVSESVGIDAVRDEIAEKILQQDGYRVIAVVGMGGLGKTFLTQHVFHLLQNKAKAEIGPVVGMGKTEITPARSFDYMVWLAVSQKFVVKELLLEMSRQIGLPNHQNRNQYLTAEELRASIHQHLHGKRSLFVLDDVWHIDDLQKIGLPSETKNKTVVTTRDRRVAEAMSDHHVHKMQCLSPENSWRLFCIHAFPSPDHRPPTDLEEVTDKIVGKCGGLPLAVKTIAGSMARVRKLRNDWESILSHLNEVEAISYNIMPSLRLSYQALPYHIKQCFMYCSVFPKNTQIESQYLLHAWIAEGFISTQEASEDVYDIASRYMDELVDRCLIEASRGGDGRVEHCKLHDLLHDIALSEFNKQTKCFLKPGEQLKEFPGRDKCVGLRRISLISNNITKIKEAISSPGLRTLWLRNNNLSSISPSFFNDLKYLAVLDLRQTSIDVLPKSVGNLSQLKFLNLSATKIKKLPKSLSSLKHLQFLDVSLCCDLERLHSGIGKHKSLRHLNAEDCNKLVSLPDGLSKLGSLKTLKGAVFKMERAANAKAFRRLAAATANLIKTGLATNAKPLQLMDIKGLTRLQHLSLRIHPSDRDFQLEEGTFKDMTEMRTLSFKNMNKSCLLILPKELKDMEHLENVFLRGCVVPTWISMFQNLMELVLDGTGYSSPNEGHYDGLEKIPNLRKLILIRNNCCENFPKEFGKEMAFPKLEYLTIEKFIRLQELPQLHNAAMPILKHLRIGGCKLRDGIPEELRRRESQHGLKIDYTDAASTGKNTQLAKTASDGREAKSTVDFDSLPSDGPNLQAV